MSEATAAAEKHIGGGAEEMGDQRVPEEDEEAAVEEVGDGEQGTKAPVRHVDKYKGEVAVEQKTVVRVGEATAGYVDRVTESKAATEEKAKEAVAGEEHEAEAATEEKAKEAVAVAVADEERDAEAAAEEKEVKEAVADEEKDAEAAAEQEQPHGPEWVILAAVPRVEPTSQFPLGDHVACVLKDVPGVSLLRISRWISYDHRSLDCHPHVLAVDPSGVMLLFSGTDTGPPEPVEEDRPDLYYTTCERKPYQHPSYFLCYPNSGVAAIIPDRGTKKFGQEILRSIRFPNTYAVSSFNWVTDRVISHNGSLWWVSLTDGLVTCDLFDPESRYLKHVPLPVPEGYSALHSGSIDRLSCASDSSGMIRYVLFYRRFSIPTVEMWSLTDSVAGVWRSEYSVPMSAIWSAPSYPVIALVHPMNPVVLFFLHESRMLSIDMIGLNVLQSQNINLEFPPATDICSRFFHAWRLQVVPDAIQQPRPPNWVMVASLPRVEPRNQFRQGQDVSCTLEMPPEVTTLVMSRRVCIMPRTIYCPMIVCTTPSGVFLLLGSHRLPEGKAEIKGSEITVTMDTKARQCFHLCNIYKEDSLLLPSTEHQINTDFVGLLTDARNSGRLIVAELVPPPMLSSEPPTLFCIENTGRRQWHTKTLEYSHEHTLEWWKCHSVVVYDGELWWFVPNHGLFHCNPFCQKPHLKHTELPVVPRAPYMGSLDYSVRKERCVRVSAGKLRYLVVYGTHESPVVRMYTLEIDEDGDEEWVELYELEFSLSIFINASYITHNLLKMKPVIALIDPICPHIVYFCQDKRIFSIDFDLGVVLSCRPLEMLDWGGNWDNEWIEGRYATVQWSKYFHAWELPSTHCLMGLMPKWTE